MLQKILNILLILSTSILIYISNTPLLYLSLFLLIFLTFLNKNYFSIISIIPLFFINQTAFIFFLIMWVGLLFVSYKIQNLKIRACCFLTISGIYAFYEILVNNIDWKIIIFSFLILIISLLLFILNKDAKVIITNILFLSVSVFTIPFINVFVFLFIYAFYILYETLMYSKNYYLITAFFITIYGMFFAKELLYIAIQLLAYLGYFLKNKNIESKTNFELEYALENINNNITDFCTFLNHFSKISYNNDYEKRLSEAIKILIESHCLTCKERSVCYANKKLKTYIYLKDLLTKKGQENFTESFSCKNYFVMAERANELQIKYELYSSLEIDDIKIIGICSSIQSYFVSSYENISPEILKLSNFKKILIEAKINFYNFDYKIISESIFEFKIYSKNTKDLLTIVEYSKFYFDSLKTTIELRNGYVCIYPKKKYKILFDHASLSVNNCQISGDNILTKNIYDVNFICALSDGMGSGYYAYQLSQETLKLVDNITNCNISFDSSLQILNNFFRTRDLSECYATLDLVNIDLINGILNLYKLGSSTTYISRGDKIIPIYNNNLPFGINDLITKEEFQLIDDDLIVLVSDGVNDYINESTLTKYIETLKHEQPHKIVYEILQRIYHENKNTIKDDMSCIAIKIKNI